ncbi:transcriptional repressor [Candidatus Woesearchaeota archaeon]|nr:transcriptional repressor [Candidatus Woesearchaeota archaeon]
MARQTKQKQILTDALKKLDLFFDAFELHQRVAKSRIGIATVYRFLKQLEEKEEIHAFLCNDQKIYSLNKKNHAHFTCEICGKIEHLNIKKVDFLRVSGKACHFQLDVKGKCNGCFKKEKIG